MSYGSVNRGVENFARLLELGFELARTAVRTTTTQLLRLFAATRRKLQQRRTARATTARR